MIGEKASLFLTASQLKVTLATSDTRDRTITMRVSINQILKSSITVHNIKLILFMYLQYFNTLFHQYLSCTSMYEQADPKHNPIALQNSLFPKQSFSFSLGYVTFHTHTLTKLKKQQLKVNYLASFYPPHYLERVVQNIINLLPNNVNNQEVIRQMKQNLQQHFTLEFVFDYHFQFVSHTTQQTFNLRNSQFRFQKKCKIPTFREQNFWQIRFTKLKTLNLSSANILSLEPLTYCDLPLIEKLQIDDNYIISLSALSRCRFKYLTQIKCYKNPIIFMGEFNRSHIPSLVKLQIDDNNRKQFEMYSFSPDKRKIHYYQSLQILDFLIKTQSNHIQNLKQCKLSFSQRIQPKWYSNKLELLNNGMQIFTSYQVMNRRSIQMQLNARGNVRGNIEENLRDGIGGFMRGFWRGDNRRNRILERQFFDLHDQFRQFGQQRPFQLIDKTLRKRNRRTNQETAIINRLVNQEWNRNRPIIQPQALNVLALENGQL